MRLGRVFLAAVAVVTLIAAEPVDAAAPSTATCVGAVNGLVVARVSGGGAVVEGVVKTKKVRYRSVAVSDASGVVVLAGLPVGKVSVRVLPKGKAKSLTPTAACLAGLTVGAISSGVSATKVVAGERVVIGAGAGYLVVPDAAFKSALVKVQPGQTLKTTDVRSVSGPVAVDTGGVSPRKPLLFELDVTKGPTSATETAVTVLFRALGSTTTVTLPARQNGTVVRAELPGPGTIEVIDAPAASAGPTQGAIDVVAGGIITGPVNPPLTTASSTAATTKAPGSATTKPGAARLPNGPVPVTQNRARFADIEFALQSAEIRDTKPNNDGSPSPTNDGGAYLYVRLTAQSVNPSANFLVCADINGLSLRLASGLLINDFTCSPKALGTTVAPLGKVYKLPAGADLAGAVLEIANGGKKIPAFLPLNGAQVTTGYPIALTASGQGDVAMPFIPQQRDCGTNVTAVVREVGVDIDDTTPQRGNETTVLSTTRRRADRSARFLRLVVGLTFRPKDVPGPNGSLCKGSLAIGPNLMKLTIDGFDKTPRVYAGPSVTTEKPTMDVVLYFDVAAKDRQAELVLGDPSIAALRVPLSLPIMPSLPGE